MTDNPALHHRRSIRLPGYDYASEGSYFITLVTHDRECLFGRIVNDEMVLSPLGEIVRDEWFRTAAIRENVELFDDEFVIMPNHVHGIINITPPACTGTVGIVGAYCNTPLLYTICPHKHHHSVLHQIRSVQSSVVLNPRQPNELISFAIPPDSLCGSVIISTESSARIGCMKIS
jgi:hypothetical protein